jgi:hypothetical protein
VERFLSPTNGVSLRSGPEDALDRPNPSVKRAGSPKNVFDAVEARFTFSARYRRPNPKTHRQGFKSRRNWRNEKMAAALSPAPVA